MQRRPESFESWETTVSIIPDVGILLSVPPPKLPAPNSLSFASLRFTVPRATQRPPPQEPGTIGQNFGMMRGDKRGDGLKVIYLQHATPSHTSLPQHKESLHEPVAGPRGQARGTR